MFPRDWAVEIAEDTRSIHSGPVYTYEVGSRSRVEFSLTDEGGITNPRAVPLTDGSDGRKLVQPNACIQNGNVSWTFATSFTVLQIESGKLRGGLS